MASRTIGLLSAKAFLSIFFGTSSPSVAKHASATPLLLSSFLPATTIITLNYRLAPAPSPYAFPVPIFDALKAFDYITSPHSPHNGGRTPRLSLYGSRIGSLLATTVALTEPKVIHSLAVSESLVDWVSLDENQEKNSTKSSTTRRKAKASTLGSLPDPARLLSIRSKLFHTPETYFDTFASPTFSSAHRAVTALARTLTPLSPLLPHNIRIRC